MFICGLVRLLLFFFVVYTTFAIFTSTVQPVVGRVNRNSSQIELLIILNYDDSRRS